eukprot:jgi/Psemu1/57423/gm1.57423_g
MITRTRRILQCFGVIRSHLPLLAPARRLSADFSLVSRDLQQEAQVAEGSPPFATTIGLSAEGAEELMAAPEYHSRQLMDGLDSLLVGVAGAMAMISINIP